MRSDREMLSLIVGTAERDERVRAVILTGSRADPESKPDALQDYDIVYAVRSVAPFIEDKSWLAVFGEIAIMQEPDDAALFPNASDNAAQYAYLMQFKSGERIDLTVRQEDEAERVAKADPLSVALLDKDARYAGLPDPGGAAYRLTLPREQAFAACQNEFYWTSAYVAKGLWRGELLYALYHINHCVRPELCKMLGYRVCAAGKAARTGKCYKHLPELLPAEDAAALYQTYPPAETGAIWAALDAALDLFDKSAAAVAANCGFRVREEDRRGAREYLRFARELKQ